jgi:lipopolysaccharide biosynthesis protein/SAM-dependent methyltransferase
MASEELNPDGERYLPVFKGTIRLEHYHRYYLAGSLCADKDVLDIASGEGFGSALLARHARSVLGVDISEAAVRHATKSYASDRLTFQVGSATAIPLDDASVDLAVSFETIEHHAEHEEMLSELRRVLRPGGLLILSSPNKAEYSDKPAYKNPFHVRELYTDELLALVGRHFPVVRHYGQRVTAASVIGNADAPGMFRNYRHHESRPGVADAVYDIVLASDGPLPELEHSIFEELDSPLQPNSVEARAPELERIDAIQREIQALRASVDGDVPHHRDEASRHQLAVQEREAELAKSRADLATYQNALHSAISDANRIVGDKWWRRTKGLRRISNSIRKLQGKRKKKWPNRFVEDVYLNRTPPAVVRSSHIAPAGRDPVSGDQYPATIQAVNFSDVSEEFVPFRENPQLDTSPRAIAFYLPQFHPFPENDEWWGKGFTEWTNVGRAKPLFEGHHQPHCPIHLGYYDLRLPEVMEEQARIARSYGVNGFAYYFYWFAGKVLMDRPLEGMLSNPRVDIPFCFIWANENWTRRWDGMESDVLIAQDHSLEDSRALLQHLRRFFDDKRYILIDGKPLFIVYRPGIIPDIRETLGMWREEARAMGFPGLYLVSAQTFGHRDPREYGFDAAMDFPPHTAESGDVRASFSRLDPSFSGNIFDYDSVVGNAVTRAQEDYKVFPTTMLSWDNTARKAARSNIFANFSVTRYSQWLSSNAERVAKDRRFSPDEKMIFINAWNEWAEGTHLEPDQRHGFGYLEATRRVMSHYTRDAETFLDPRPASRRSDAALIIHLHFTDLWSELSEAVRSLAQSVDIYATATSLEAAKAIVADFPDASIELVDNRGRDIRPFLHVFRKIRALDYTAIAKVHGKKSSYRADGDALRSSAYRAILTPAALDRVMSDPSVGLLAPASLLVAHSDKNMTYSGALTRSIADSIGVSFKRGRFPAGSMFWFRPQALDPLLAVPANEFDIERGLVDGTRAHAIERLFGTVCESRGYRIAEI